MIRRPPRSTPFPTRRSSDLPKIDDPVGRRAGWHLIGHLQRNKAKLVPGRFALVKSVDSLALAERSEEHTSELQSRLHLVCRLLLEKKKKKKHKNAKQ